MTELTDNPGNLLFNSIAKDCGLEQWMESVEFPVGHEIVGLGGVLDHFYFPTTGVLSTVVHLKEGSVAETLNVGSEGLVGVPLWLGVSRSLEAVLQQMPGRIIRVPARIFLKRIVGRLRTERLLKRFTAYTLRYGSQTALCNSRHNVQERVSRRLLNMADRVRSMTLQTTHSVVAHALGIRRQSVSEATHKMQQARIISNRRGTIRILDRRGLEGWACECYREMRSLYDQLVRSSL